MAITAQLAPQALLSGIDSTASWTSMEFGVDVATRDSTTFGTVPFATAVPSIRSLVCNLDGFQDFAAGALDEWLRANVGGTVVATLAPLSGAVGTVAAISRGVLGGYRPINAAVGDIPAVQVVVNPGGTPVAEGLVVQASTTPVTVTASTVGQQIGAISAAQNVFAAIHVLSVAGTASPSISAQIQSGPTLGGAYVNRGAAGAALTAVGGQWLSTALAAPVTDTFWRVTWTITGTTPSFAVVASLAIA
ncbi:MAG: hypothetical protein RJA49_2424 [Actinomycetota bacterium]